MFQNYLTSPSPSPPRPALQLGTMLVQTEWLVLPGGRHVRGPFRIVVEEEAIADVQRCGEDLATPPLDSEDVINYAHLATPGFVDMHTHGVG